MIERAIERTALRSREVALQSREVALQSREVALQKRERSKIEEMFLQIRKTSMNS